MTQYFKNVSFSLHIGNVFTRSLNLFLLDASTVGKKFRPATFCTIYSSFLLTNIFWISMVMQAESTDEENRIISKTRLTF